MTYYKSVRIIDGKPRLVIVNEDGKIININPSKEELKGLKRDLYKRNEKNKSYAKNYLLNELKRFQKEESRVPKSSDFVNNPGYPSFAAYQRHFGSWNNAIIEAGLKTNHGGIEYTKEELLDALILFEKEEGRIPVGIDFTNNPWYPNVSTYLRQFGSWSNALKLVGMDLDTRVMQGHLDTNQEKGRFAEIKVINHFIQHPIDLAGENSRSPYDGICPNGKFYDVKSSVLENFKKRFQFATNNKYKDKIEIYYFLAFNEDYTKLDYAWRVPGEIVEGNVFYVYIINSYKYNIENMKEYEITDKFKDVF